MATALRVGWCRCLQHLIFLLTIVYFFVRESSLAVLSFFGRLSMQATVSWLLGYLLSCLDNTSTSQFVRNAFLPGLSEPAIGY